MRYNAYIVLQAFIQDSMKYNVTWGICFYDAEGIKKKGGKKINFQKEDPKSLQFQADRVTLSTKLSVREITSITSDNTNQVP